MSKMNPQQMHMMHPDQRVMQMRQPFPDQVSFYFLCKFKIIT